MRKGIRQLDDNEQRLKVLTDLERKVNDKWVSFKKKLRANKSLDPDYADQKYREEEAKFDQAIKSIEEEREKSISKMLHA